MDAGADGFPAPVGSSRPTMVSAVEGRSLVLSDAVVGGGSAGELTKSAGDMCGTIASSVPVWAWTASSVLRMNC